MADVLSPTPDGELVGSAEVQTIFEIGKLGKVAGCMIKVGSSDDVAHKDLVSSQRKSNGSRRCMIKDGYMKKGANVRVMQGDAIMYDGKLKVSVGGCAGFGGGVAVVSSLEVICSTVVVAPSGRTRDNPHTAVAVSRRARRRERDDDDDDDRSRAAHTSGRFGRRDCETRTCGATAVPAAYCF